VLSFLLIPLKCCCLDCRFPPTLFFSPRSHSLFFFQFFPSLRFLKQLFFFFTVHFTSFCLFCPFPSFPIELVTFPPTDLLLPRGFPFFIHSFNSAFAGFLPTPSFVFEFIRQGRLLQYPTWTFFSSDGLSFHIHFQCYFSWGFWGFFV